MINKSEAELIYGPPRRAGKSRLAAERVSQEALCGKSKAPAHTVFDEIWAWKSEPTHDD